MFCRKCGKEIPDDSDFCPKCGEDLRESEKKESPTIEPQEKRDFRKDLIEHEKSVEKNKELLEQEKYYTNRILFAVGLLSVVSAIVLAIIGHNVWLKIEPEKIGHVYVFGWGLSAKCGIWLDFQALAVSFLTVFTIICAVTKFYYREGKYAVGVLCSVDAFFLISLFYNLSKRKSDRHIFLEKIARIADQFTRYGLEMTSETVNEYLREFETIRDRMITISAGALIATTVAFVIVLIVYAAVGRKSKLKPCGAGGTRGKVRLPVWFVIINVLLVAFIIISPIVVYNVGIRP